MGISIQTFQRNSNTVFNTICISYGLDVYYLNIFIKSMQEGILDIGTSSYNILRITRYIRCRLAWVVLIQ